MKEVLLQSSWRLLTTSDSIGSIEGFTLCLPPLPNHMVSNRSQHPKPYHVTDSARKLRREPTIVRREERLQASQFRDVVLRENLGDPEGGDHRSGYRVNRCAPTGTVRDEQDVLASVARMSPGDQKGGTRSLHLGHHARGY